MTRTHDQDELMREAIAKELKASPAPLMSSNEAWEQLSKQLPDPYKSPRPSRFRRHMKKLPWAASLLLVALVSSMFASQESSGFNWFYRYWTTMKGTVTTLFISIADKPNDPGKNQPLPPVSAELDTDNSLAFTREMSLADAQQVTSFRILVPANVPADYHLSHVLVYFTDEENSHEVELIYKNHDSRISIRQFTLVGSYNSSSGIDHEDTHLQDLNLSGMQETLMHHDDGSSTLMWNNSFMQLIIRSSLSEEQLLAMINSM